MGVYIPNMEKPKGCYECPIARSYIDCLMETKYICPIGHTDDCPLIDIPTPHGRLIDWDAFNNKLDIQYAEGRGKALAPTILEAEE